MRSTIRPIVLCCLLAAAGAPAQDGPLEEIIVTAQKREQDLQDVPVSVSAFSGDVLEDRGIDDPSALAIVTPGLVYSNLLGYSLIYLRGVGSDAFQPTADQSVATYLDGVYLPFSHGQVQDFIKLERVEVLKGPQGTLFGRNATGGAINVITRKPTREFELDLDVIAGNDDTRELKASMTGPLYGSLFGSVSAIHSHADVDYEMQPDSPVQELVSDVFKGINGRLQWDVTETLSATASALVTRLESTGPIVNTAEQVKPLGQVVGVREGGPREASLDFQPFLGAKSDLFYGQVAWSPRWFDLKLFGSTQEVHTETRYDFDASRHNIALFDVPDQFSETTTGELQLLSKPEGLLPDWIQLTSGLYYYDSDAGYADVNLAAASPDRLDALPVPPELQGLLGELQPTIDGLRGLLAEASASAGVPVPTDLVNLKLVGHVATEAYAAYAQTTVDVMGWANLTLGGRYQRERRGVRSAKAFLNTSTGPLLIAQYPDRTTTRESFSPRVTVDFSPIEGQLLYFTWSRAEKSGTYNLPAIYTPPRFVRPETVTAYEIGNKGLLFGGTFRYQIAAFRNEIEDLQTQIVSLASGGAQNLVNAAEAEIQGIELDLAWQALPQFLPGFLLTGAAAYLDGEYTAFPNASGFDEETGLFFGEDSLIGSPGRDFTGNETVRTPEWTATIGPSLDLDAPGGSVELGADVNYNSSYFFDTQNTAGQPRHVLLNARLAYTFEAWNLSLSLYGKNLLGENYYVNRFPTDFATNSTWAADQLYGARLSYRF